MARTQVGSTQTMAYAVRSRNGAQKLMIDGVERSIKVGTMPSYCGMRDNTRDGWVYAQVGRNRVIIGELWGDRWLCRMNAISLLPSSAQDYVVAQIWNHNHS
jgi:hypothetical protein